MPRRKKQEWDDRPVPAPATTVEGRENQLVALAVDLAEKQMREGTASAAVITHYLKLGSTREQKEIELLKEKTALMAAQVEESRNRQQSSELFEEALAAMRSYQGHESEDEYDD